MVVHLCRDIAVTCHVFISKLNFPQNVKKVFIKNQLFTNPYAFSNPPTSNFSQKRILITVNKPRQEKVE